MGRLTPVGPRAKLFRKLLGWIGLISPSYETSLQLANDSTAYEPYFKICFSDMIVVMSLHIFNWYMDDLWEPASMKACGNDVWKRIKSIISILLSPSTLQANRHTKVSSSEKKTS